MPPQETKDLDGTSLHHHHTALIDDGSHHHRAVHEPTKYTSIRSLFQSVEDDENDAIEDEIYGNAVDRACRSILPACHFEEQFDLIMHCRQPLSFLSFFNRHPVAGRDGVDMLPLGVYSVPEGCEYCGAPSTTTCTADCQRPKFFFQKKRPPFEPPGERWDPVTDYEKPQLVEKSEDREDLKNRSWMSAMF